MKTNEIQLTEATETIEQLNILLANYQMYYQNLRGYHWNIKGTDFFQLHTKFEEYYTAAADTIDEIAERILTLGGQPFHSFKSYIENSSIEAKEGLATGKACVEAILHENRNLLEMMRKIVKIAADNDDEGTNDMLTPVINTLEKDNWMLGAYLG